ncbi:SRPBCC family protein [Pseudonocardia sp. Cha107L01]|uniref:SRPBCC family protein n=1 Tax=Pseudonocardia sp. Cha107L01 TaxID=3457576 RepID=UPI00403EC46F
MTATGKTAETAETLNDASPGDALRDAGQKLLGLLVQRAAQAATDRVGGLADRLGDVAKDGGPGLSAALSGGKSLAEGDSPVRSAVSAGLTGLKEKVKGMFGGGGGGSGKKLKVTNIVEEIDIGLPLRVTYDLWTQFEDFPGYMKKVKSVEQAADEKVNWKAQIFWSNRSWEATILEQVPDSHIVWRSKGAKGHVNGAVSFTELGPNLTRVLLVLEYYPQGLFERTGNIWRAQGRRTRLEFKHFRRNAMANAILHQDEIEGWRGEIRDSEVVRSHEDALRDEEEQTGGPDDEQVDGADDGDRVDEADEADEAEDAYEEDDAEGEYEDEDQYDDEYDDVDEEDEYDDADDRGDQSDDDDEREQDEDVAEPADDEPEKERRNGRPARRRAARAGGGTRQGR